MAAPAPGGACLNQRWAPVHPAVPCAGGAPLAAGQPDFHCGAGAQQLPAGCGRPRLRQDPGACNKLQFVDWQTFLGLSPSACTVQPSQHVGCCLTAFRPARLARLYFTGHAAAALRRPALLTAFPSWPSPLTVHTCCPAGGGACGGRPGSPVQHQPQGSSGGFRLD